MAASKGDRTRRPSVFMCPISASMMLRRRGFATGFGVRPRRTRYTHEIDERAPQNMVGMVCFGVQF